MIQVFPLPVIGWVPSSCFCSTCSLQEGDDCKLNVNATTTIHMAYICIHVYGVSDDLPEIYALPQIRANGPRCPPPVTLRTLLQPAVCIHRSSCFMSYAYLSFSQERSTLAHTPSHTYNLQQYVALPSYKNGGTTLLLCLLCRHVIPLSGKEN